MSSPLHAVATLYRNAGLSVIPCKAKRPKVGWSEYQSAIPTDEQISSMFGTGGYDQIAVICGAVSGSLEVIDVDLKNDTTGTLWDMLWNDLVEYFNNHMPLTVIKTMSGGVHLYYRCDIIEGNQKLASEPVPGTSIIKTTIETRGEGGYVIAPPSPGYTFWSEVDPRTGPRIQTITPDQRTDILDICRKYNKVFKTEKPKVSAVQASVYKETPWDHYNADEADPWISIMMQYGWKVTRETSDRIYFTKEGSDNPNKANWNRDKRLLYVFSTSTEFEGGKAYTPFAIYAILACHSDFSEATKQLRKAGYGATFSASEENLITKAQGLMDKGMPDYLDLMRLLEVDFEACQPEVRDMGKEDRGKAIEKGLEPLIKAAQERANQAKGLFWTIGKKKVEISLLGLVNFLDIHGFRLFVQERTSELFRVVRIDYASHIIHEMPMDVIKKFVFKWARENADEYQVSAHMLLEAIIAFKDWRNITDHMERISITDVSFLRDTRTSSYLPFKNCIVHITANDIVPIQYQDLPEGMLLWANQINPKVIEILNLEKEEELNASPTYRFIKRISGITPDLESLPLPQLRDDHPHLFDKFLSFVTGMGYLLSNYKDPGRPYSIILAEDTPSDKDGGGAGKDLLMKFIGKLRSVCTLPGRLWKPTANFAFQTYKLGDDVLYLSDLDKYFNYEQMYNSITEGLTIEKKNKDALTIPYELSPKVAGSTNYAPDRSASHSDRRFKVLLFAKWYDKSRRPEDELGGMFWSDEWTHSDWMLFYLMLFTCIQTFLDQGIVEFVETENMKAKAVRLKFGEEFLDFIGDWIKENAGTWCDKKEMYEAFLEDAGTDKKAYSFKRFSTGLEFYAGTMGITRDEKRVVEKNDGPGRDKWKRITIFVKKGQAVPDYKNQSLF